ncbi:NAD(P)-binding protein [Clavulina sp. PMI_390]|nr:NAD(P)-binding protein [Clavulina sp. PMI_390]
MSLPNTYLAVKEIFPPKATCSAANVPDLTGKVMLVTGGNAGIGKETARILLRRNARVYIACRSLTRAQAALDYLKSSTGKTDDDLRVLSMDLGDLRTIKAAVDDFLSKESRLDVLFNSAGVMVPPISMLTSHGHDLQFGTHVLGHYYLTQLLIPTLLASVKTSSDNHVRIVNVSSNSHWSAPTEKLGGPILYETLVEGQLRTKMGSQALYSQSKAGTILMSNALARKYGPQGIVSISVNPGVITTELQRHMPSFVKWLVSFIWYDLAHGVINPLYAGTAPEGLALNGKYLKPWALQTPSRADLAKEEHQEKMLEWCESEIRKFALGFH